MDREPTQKVPSTREWAKSQFRLAQYLYRGLGLVQVFWALLTLVIYRYFPGVNDVNSKISLFVLVLLCALMFAATFLLGRCPVCNVLAPIPNRKTCRKCGTELL